MGAVFDFIADTMDVVGDVLEVVGDVVDVIATPVTAVLDVVATTVDNVIKDPLPTLLAIGGQMIGIPMPVTMGAITAAKGGSLEDIVLSAGTSYFAPSIGSGISGAISSTLVDSGVNASVSGFASDAISRGLVNGAMSEIKGGNFEDGFAGGAIGSLVSGGFNSLNTPNQPIGEEFDAAKINWDIDEPEGKQTYVAGIPDELVSQVAVSPTGVNTESNTATSDISTLPTAPINFSDYIAPPDSVNTVLAQAPTGQTAADFPNLTPGEPTPVEVPKSVSDIGLEPTVLTPPVGGLAAASATPAPDTPVNEAPIAGNLPTTMSPTTPPATSGLVASQGDTLGKPFKFQPSDLLKPLISTAGNLITKAITQPKQAPRPVGGLQMAQAPRTVAPPPRVDVSSLKPIQKAVAPPKTLPSTAKLTPVSNIAGLSSLLKKTG